MKKLLALAGIFTLCFTGAFAQGLPFNKTMTPKTKVFQQKAALGLDSTLTEFKTYDYDDQGNIAKEYFYELDSATMTIVMGFYINYEYDSKNRVIAKTYLSATGDTMQTTLYSFSDLTLNRDGETNLSVETYYYEDMDPILVMESYFYGLKENENFTTVFSYLSFEEMFGTIYLCDSLDLTMYEENDEGEIEPTSLHGIFSYDAQGTPTKLAFQGLEVGDGISVDINIVFTSENQLLKTMKIEFAMMGGLMKIDILQGNAVYNNSLLSELYLEPVSNDYFDVSDMLGLGKVKLALAYNNSTLHSIGYYEYDDAAEIYTMSSKEYYIYKENKTDSVKTYYYAEGTAVRNANSIEVTVAPNPVHSALHISGLQSATQIDVCDASGRVVLKQNVQAAETDIQMQSLSNGIYFVRMRNAEGTSVKKVVKE